MRVMWPSALLAICVSVFFTLADACANPAKGLSIVSDTKWHPGNYLLVPLGSGTKGFDEALDLARAKPYFKGIQKRYTWRELEPKHGMYDFSPIIEDLAKVRVARKRLVIQIQAKSFRASEIFIPGYLLSQEYQGGVERLVSGGTMPRLWDKRILERLIALYAALGDALDQEPLLEAVIIPESAVGRFLQRPDDFDRARYINNLIVAMQRLKLAFPTTVVIQYVNYPVEELNRLTAMMLSSGVGIGGPDVFPHNEKLALGAYTYYSKMAGNVPIGVAVQDDNYTAKRPSGEYDPTGVGEIYTFARDSLKANYIFWLIKRKPQDYIGRVSTLLDDPTVPGLTTTCPKVFSACALD